MLLARNSIRGPWVATLFAISCAAPTQPGPATSVASEPSPSAATPTSPSQALAQDRLLVADSVCAALPSGVYCTHSTQRAGALGTSVKVAAHGDIVGLVAHEDLLCGRKRGGPAICWRTKAGRVEEWQLDHPPHPTSVAVGPRAHVCATSATGELWCGGFGEAATQETPPKPLDFVRGWDAREICGRSLEGESYCRSEHSAWALGAGQSADYSPTIGCLLIGAPDNYVCAWRDEADQQAIERAYRRATRRFDDAIEIDGTDEICVVRLGGEFDCATTIGRSDVDPLDALFAKGPMRDAPTDVVEVETNNVVTCVLTERHEVWCRGEIGVGVHIKQWTQWTPAVSQTNGG